MNSNKKPIIEQEVNLSYTKGLYKFFCKTTARVFLIVIAILSSISGRIRREKFEQLAGLVWIVNHMARKLEGISSVSTSVHDNCICARWRKIKDCICAHCYAYNQQARHTGLREHNIINGMILRNVLIPVYAFKKVLILFPYLRIESFGDVANVIQARNYLRLIKAFPDKRCAIWSKNAAIWKEAIEKEGKPRNTTFVLSSPYINKPVAETILENFPFIDHIFTVYTKQYAIKNNIVINCGGRKCMECIKAKTNCYFRGGPLYINELKK